MPRYCSMKRGELSPRFLRASSSLSFVIRPRQISRPASTLGDTCASKRMQYPRLVFHPSLDSTSTVDHPPAGSEKTPAGSKCDAGLKHPTILKSGLMNRLDSAASSSLWDRSES